MTLHTSIRLFAALLALSAAAVTEAQSITVGDTVHVSRDLAKAPQYEMMLAADPNNADHLIACTMVFPRAEEHTSVATYNSFDRGQTWKLTHQQRADGHRESWDPACLYGPDGVAYTVSENVDFKERSYDQINRSTDGGHTWDEGTRFKHAERNFITVDMTNGPRRGWLYLHGMGHNCVKGIECDNASSTYMQFSRDGGKTFLGQLIAASKGGYALGGGPGVVLSDGTYLSPYGEVKNFNGMAKMPDNLIRYTDQSSRAELKVARMTESRVNWPLELNIAKVGDWYMGWGASNQSVMAYMAADASTGPFRDRAYIVWTDAGLGRARVLLSYSDDKGSTWSAPRSIDDLPGQKSVSDNYDSLHGMVAVDAQGVVGVTWFDRRDQTDNLSWDVRFRASFDGGETFTPSVKVNKVSYNPQRTSPVPLQPMARNGERIGIHWFNYSGGHTAGFAADAAGGFHPLWVGNPDGVPQLYSARVAVKGTVIKNGSPEFSKLVDATKHTKLRYTNMGYDAKSGLLEFDVAIVGPENDAVAGPLVLRINELTSAFGDPEVLNADNGVQGEGAIYKFDLTATGGSLKKDQASPPRHVSIRFKNQPKNPMTRARNDWAVSDMLLFQTRVLAATVPDKVAELEREEDEGSEARPEW